MDRRESRCARSAGLHRRSKEVGDQFVTLKLKQFLSSCLFLVATAAEQSFKPCDSTVVFANRNMIDYTIKSRHLRGSVADPTGIAVPEGCVALFNADHSKLLRTVEANENAQFAIAGVKNGDYWLLVQDRQRAFCPAAAHLKLRWYT